MSEEQNATKNAIVAASFTDVAPMLHRRGLEIPSARQSDADYLIRVGMALNALEDVTGWAIGDLALTVEMKHGIKDYLRIMRAAGFDVESKTVQNAKSAAKQYPIGERNYNLPFEHYKELAYLPADLRARALAIAESKKLTVVQLRDVRKLLPTNIGDDGKRLPPTKVDIAAVKTVLNKVERIEVDGRQTSKAREAITKALRPTQFVETTATPADGSVQVVSTPAPVTEAKIDVNLHSKEIVTLATRMRDYAKVAIAAFPRVSRTMADVVATPINEAMLLAVVSDAKGIVNEMNRAAMVAQELHDAIVAERVKATASEATVKANRRAASAKAA